MAKRPGTLKKTKIQKRGPTRTAKKQAMLKIRAMKPAQRKKALTGK